MRFVRGARELKRLFQITAGRDQVAAVRQGAGQIGQRGGGAMPIERPLVPPDVHGLFEERDCTIAESLAPVGEADALQELGAHFGLQARIVQDALRAPIEHIPGRGFMALGIERIGFRKRRRPKKAETCCA